MSKKYQVAFLLALDDYPDVIGEFDNKKEAMEFLKKKELENPRQRLAWREVS